MAQARVAQPVARVDVVTETRFGVALPDPYRWMEQGGPEFDAWMVDQGAFTDEYLAAVPERAALLARVTELTAGTVSVTKLATAGDKVFYLRQSGEDGVPVLVLRDGDTERVLLDPAKLPGDEHSSLDWYVPDHDGTRIACGISRGGSERSALHTLDVATGALSDEGVPGIARGVVSWYPDGSRLLVLVIPEPAPGTPAEHRRDNATTRLHVVGAAAEEDVVVLGPGVNPNVPIAPRDRPSVLLTEDSDWAVAMVSDGPSTGATREGWSENTIYVAPVSGLADPASCPWRVLATESDGVTAFAVHGDACYLVTHRTAPRSEVVVASLRDPDAPREVVVPGGERAVAAVQVAGDHLVVRDVDGGVSRLRRVPLAGGAIQDIELPADGTIEQWVTGPDGGLLVTFGSWTLSPRVYRCDVARGSFEDTGWLPPSTVDFSGIEVRDVRVRARDGAQIPLSVIHRRGMALDGSHPVLLNGYGSYGLTQARAFRPEMLAWYERGGAFAVAGLRGGGEFGREWHQGGRGPTKINTINDFVDCAEYLVAAGYARPESLAGEGISAGGIPTGGALVRRPDLFGAMVMRVPSVNRTRMEFSEGGSANVPEFGSVTSEDGLRDLLVMDAYARVEDGVGYPSVLLTTGLNDPRVAAWVPAKMAARLQAAGSPHVALLRVDAHAGHGFGSTLAQRNALTADVFAFLLAELGRTRTG